MTYIITEACIKCKHTDCVQVCPTDCFHEGANMLVINPSECIDCGLCVLECPINAIIADSDDDSKTWLAINEKYSLVWPKIIYKKDAPADAAEWADVEDKFEKYFSENLQDSSVLKETV